MTTSTRRPRVLWLASHPIQYQAPVFRLLGSSSEIGFHVTYLSSYGMSPSFDTGFGRVVEWDVPLRDGYSWSQIPSPPESVSMVSRRSVWREVRARRPDLVVIPGYNTRGYRAGFEAARSCGATPALLSDSTLENGIQTPLLLAAKRAFLHFVLRDAVALVPGERAALLDISVGIPRSRHFAYPHCVEMSRLDDAYTAREVHRRDVRRELGTAPETRVFICVGKLIGLKRVGAVIRAFRRAGAGELWVVGSGAEEANLRSLAGDDPTIRFLGFKNQTELPALYAASDALILFSDSETWGLVVNEGLAVGLPAIVSAECGCADDLVAGQGTGWVVRDELELERALAEAIRTDLSSRSAAARAHIDGFRPEVSARGIIEAARYAARRRSNGGVAQ